MKRGESSCFGMARLNRILAGPEHFFGSFSYAMNKDLNMKSDEILRQLILAPAKRRIAALEAAAMALKGESTERLMVSQAEAGRMLSVSRWTIRNMVAAGKLHPIRVMSAPRYSVEELKRIARGPSSNE